MFKEGYTFVSSVVKEGIIKPINELKHTIDSTVSTTTHFVTHPIDDIGSIAKHFHF
jgi:hypothetical protein